jgi:hypothetical protein
LYISRHRSGFGAIEKRKGERKNAFNRRSADSFHRRRPAGRHTHAWPSDLCDVVKHGASELSLDDQNQIRVKTGHNVCLAGRHRRLQSGHIRLVAYGPLRITVRNTTPRPLTVMPEREEPRSERQLARGSITLPPAKEGVSHNRLRITPWVLDKPLELVGMRGYPAASTAAPSTSGKPLNSTSSSTVRATRPRSTLSASKRIEAPLHLLKAETFLPFVDRFGQFIHDDWPGKVHSEAELTLSKTAEAAWLASQPEIPDRDRWGGWARDRNAEPPANFRTEKVNGVWWLVDPTAVSSFLHGVDCVHAGADTGVQYRESYFAWLPEKDSPFASFFGTAHWVAARFL